MLFYPDRAVKEQWFQIFALVYNFKKCPWRLCDCCTLDPLPTWPSQISRAQPSSRYSKAQISVIPSFLDTAWYPRTLNINHTKSCAKARKYLFICINFYQVASLGKAGFISTCQSQHSDHVLFQNLDSFTPRNVTRRTLFQSLFCFDS